MTLTIVIDNPQYDRNIYLGHPFSDGKILIERLLQHLQLSGKMVSFTEQTIVSHSDYIVRFKNEGDPYRFNESQNGYVVIRPSGQFNSLGIRLCSAEAWKVAVENEVTGYSDIFAGKKQLISEGYRLSRVLISPLD